MNNIFLQPQFYLTWIILIGGVFAYLGFKKTLFARKRRIYYDQKSQKWKSIGIFGFLKTKVLDLRETQVQTLEKHLEEIMIQEIEKEKVFLGMTAYLWKWKYLAFFGGLFLILLGCSLMIHFGSIF